MNIFLKRVSTALEIRDTLKQIKEISDGIDSCKKCGRCQSVCPVFRETGLEQMTSRGKFAMLRGLKDSVLKRPSDIEQRLRNCVLCGKCKEVCPQKIDTQSVFIKSRIVMARLNRTSFIKRLIIAAFLAFPGLDFKKSEIKKREVEGKNNQKLLFFSGCVFDKLFPEKKAKAEMLFKRLGFDIEIISGECCGIPNLSSGNLKGFLKNRESLMKRFLKSDADYIVSGCPTCLTTITKIWPEFDGFDDLLTSKFKILDFHELMEKNLEKLKFNKIDKSIKGVTWHQPCHLTSLGVKKEGELILENICREKFSKSETMNTCCGFGGTFSIDHPFLSSKIGKKRAADLDLQRNNLVVTGCPACIIQLKRITIKDKVDVVHSIDFIFDNLKVS